MKIVNPCTTEVYENKFVNVYCKIEYDAKNGRLSISGVEGPKSNGDAWGSCGQIDMHICEDKTYVNKYCDGWTKDMFDKFIAIWGRWHLNDMQAGCEHQRAAGWKDKRIPIEEMPKGYSSNRDKHGFIAHWITEKEHKDGLLSKPCPECGYKYGSAWLKEDVPKDVLAFLESLPETEKEPAWV